MEKKILRWGVYYLVAVLFQLPLGLVMFLAFTSLGLVLPDDLDAWVRRILWLVFFFSGFWGAHGIWRLLLKIPGPLRWIERLLGQSWEKKAWL